MYLSLIPFCLAKEWLSQPVTFLADFVAIIFLGLSVYFTVSTTTFTSIGSMLVGLAEELTSTGISFSLPKSLNSPIQ